MGVSVAKALRAAEKALKSGRFEEAEAQFEAILSSYPQNARARAGLKHIMETPFSAQLNDTERHAAAQLASLVQKANPLEAAVFAEAMLASHSGSFAAAQVVAEQCARIQRYDLAAKALRQALRLRDAHPRTWYNLAICLNKILDHAGAMDALEKALELRPDYDEALRLLKLTALKCSNEERALWAVQTLSERHPENAGYLCDLGDMLVRLGRYDEADQVYQKAIASDPTHLESQLATCLRLNPIMTSKAMIAQSRAGVHKALGVLTSLEASLDQVPRRLSDEPYFLAYHAENDAPIKSEIAATLRSSCPGLNYEAPHVRNWAGPAEKIRLGVCSEFLSNHTIGKLFGGYIEKLDPERYEITLIRLQSSKPDDMSRRFAGQAARVVTLRSELVQQHTQIADLELDILFYPDIGMSPDTYSLAFARLAPIQMVSWGHPDTTGIDTLDYYLSADSIEASDAQAHYSERLICFERLPCYYQAKTLRPADLDRVALGLPASGRLYGCPQTLFKFHPDFDAVLSAIVDQDPEGHIVLLEGRVPSWVRALKARWAQSAPSLLEKCVFLPHQPQEAFLALMQSMDVLLDPIHFGSGNTLYEAMSMGVPIVTWPGDFMRGRIVAGAYAQMGIENPPIASSLDEYAPLAISLAQDEGRRAILSAKLKEAAEAHLIEDDLAIEEFDQFVQAALDARRAGKLLPTRWRGSDATLSSDLKEGVS